MNAPPSPEHLANACEPRRDAHWLELTAGANEAIKAGRDDLAATGYLRALNAAEDLFRTGDMRGTTVPLPAIMNIACHNLAEMAHQHGDIRWCRRFLDRAFDRLLATAAQRDADILFRIACIQHLKYTVAELSDHLSQHPDTTRPLGTYVTQVRRTAAEVVQSAAQTKRVFPSQHDGQGKLSD
ncbi:hypothetical protein I5535_19785 [Rhodobacteraceae bacterium F11138]|nr:hypothetical protein [Rhodobacteraceae bacterium F11138]